MRAVATYACVAVVGAVLFVGACRTAMMEVDNKRAFAVRSFLPGQSCHNRDLAGVSLEDDHSGHDDPPLLDEGPEHLAFCLRRFGVKNAYYWPAVARTMLVNAGDAVGIRSWSDVLMFSITGLPVILLAVFIVTSFRRGSAWVNWLFPVPALPTARVLPASALITLDGKKVA